MAKGLVEQFIDGQQWLDSVGDSIQNPIRSAFEAGGEAGRVVKDLLNGVWLGHPLHPVITDVPIGAWTVAALLDLISASQGDDKGLDAAADIALGAGVLAALGAAVTGWTDWSDTDGKIRRVGLAHALLNVVGLGLNTASLVARRGAKKGKRGTARALSMTGYAVSGLAAYVAGELVFNLGQAVSRNAFVEPSGKFRDVADAHELEDGKMHRYKVDNTNVVLIQHEDGIHAFGGTCSHLGCGLWHGELDDHVVTCPCHGSQFDIRDGSIVHGPATDPLPSFAVKSEIGRVLVKLED